MLMLAACGSDAEIVSAEMPTAEPVAGVIAEETAEVVDEDAVEEVVEAEPTAVPDLTDEPAETVIENNGALPTDITAQLDEFLQAQVYTEGRNPEATTPGVVLLIDTPDGRYSIDRN